MSVADEFRFLLHLTKIALGNNCVYMIECYVIRVYRGTVKRKREKGCKHPSQVTTYIKIMIIATAGYDGLH